MKIVIAGAGEVGSHLAKMLSNEANEITVIDSDGERLEVLRSHTDVITVEGNPSAIPRTLRAGWHHGPHRVGNPSTVPCRCRLSLSLST